MFYRGEGGVVLVTYFVIVSFSGLQVSEDCFVDAAMEAHMADIVCRRDCVYFVVKLRWEVAIVDNWFGIGIRSSDPHDLHFPFATGQPDMNLPVP